jgi:acetyl-CoA acetyltransferase
MELGMAKYVMIVYGDNAYSAGLSPYYGGRPFQSTQAERGWAVTYGLAGAAAYIPAQIARAHMARYGTTSRQLGLISVAERKYAAINPEARFYGRPITIEDHENSPMVADPIRVLDCCLQSDGGIAFIVTSVARARDCKSKPVYIKGIGTGTHFRMVAQGRNRDCYVESDASTAGKQAFKMAGIELKDIDVAEIYDAFTPVVLCQLEDYGFCKKGEGGPWVEDGNMDPDSGRCKIPINTQGGQLGWDYLVGMTPLSEAIRQARGECGERQVKNAELVMATGFAGATGGSPGHTMTHTQSCVVLGCSKG